MAQTRIPMERATRQAQEDPFAAFGGRELQTGEDPFAAFGGRAVDAAPSGPGPITRGVSQFNRGVTNVLGLPVDAMSGALSILPEPLASRLSGGETPAGGSESIRNLFNRLGITTATEEPSGFGEALAEGAGEAGAGMVPLAALFSRMGAAGGVTGDIGRTLAEPFMTRPATAAAVEMAAGGGAGGGQRLAAEATDDPVLQMLAAMAGAMTAGGAVAAGTEGLRAGARSGSVIRRALMPARTREGAQPRAGSRLTSLAADEAQAVARIEAGTIGGLTPAQATGDPQLMALERLLTDMDPKLAARRLAGMEASAARLEQSVFDIGGPGTSDMLRGAGQRAQARMDALGPQADPQQLSVIVREELNSALREARGAESALWQSIPPDAIIDNSYSREIYQRVRSELGMADADDIPAEARRFLGNETVADAPESLLVDPQGHPIPLSAAMPEAAEWSFRDAHSLYSKLQETVRNSLAGDTPNRNRARIAGILADAVWEDIVRNADVSDAVKAARQFSAQLNRTFRQGTPGRILGYERTGGTRISPEMTLDRVIGGTGTRAAVQERELVAALRYGGRQDAEAVQAIEQFMSRRFLQASNPDTFMKQNAQLLSQYPQLQARMQAAAESRALVRRLGRLKPEIRTIMDSGDPETAMKALATQARTDPDGQALVRGGVVDYLFQTGRMSDTGQPVLSGQRALSALDNPDKMKALSAVLSGDQLTRLRTLATELTRLDAARTATSPLVTEAMGPANLLQTMVRLVSGTIGARFGAQLGRGTSGASLRTASMGSRQFERVANFLMMDKAEDLLREAVFDDKLYLALMKDAGTESGMRMAQRALADWVWDSYLSLDAMADPALMGFMVERATDLAGRRIEFERATAPE